MIEKQKCTWSIHTDTLMWVQKTKQATEFQALASSSQIEIHVRNATVRLTQTKKNQKLHDYTNEGFLLNKQLTCWSSSQTSNSAVDVWVPFISGCSQNNWSYYTTCLYIYGSFLWREISWNTAEVNKLKQKKAPPVAAPSPLVLHNSPSVPKLSCLSWILSKLEHMCSFHGLSHVKLHLSRRYDAGGTKLMLCTWTLGADTVKISVCI